MKDRLKQIGKSASEEIRQAPSLEVLEKTRIQYLGKKGSLQEVMKELGKIPASERPGIGATANQVKAEIEALLETRKQELEEAQLEVLLASEKLDISVPSRQIHRGSTHVLTQTTQRIISIFEKIGFDVTVGPEVETDYLNFEAVNIPEDHPARDMQDTFYLGPGVLLRTQTSPVQIRAMLKNPFPVRVLSPGAVYRCDDDATHSPMFHQVEGLWVDRNVRMSDLKGVLQFFAQEMFGPKTQIRLRPSYFPFVEPGAEVDVSCFQCAGKPSSECRICKGTGWLEILGAGMVHPRLLETVGYPVEQEPISGFAFGIGVERVAMLLYQIPDLRLMFQGDMRMARQF